MTSQTESAQPAASVPDYIRAHKHSTHHRAEIEASKVCGCFQCLKTFSPKKITDWWDEDAQTPVCPKCGIDSVIGSASGFPITRAFLRKMYEHWFGV